MFAEALVCLALNVYHEARDQPFIGQVAVAKVVMNRVHDDRYHDDVCEVVMQGPTYSWKPDFPVRHRCQFSGTATASQTRRLTRQRGAS